MDTHLTVMVIEDEELLLHAIVKKLESKGIGAISCISGKQAIDYLNSLDHLPDAIWLDYYLKDMDGLEFMHTFKKNKQWSEIPVIVISNSANQDTVDKMFALGVKKYFLKDEHKLSDLVDTAYKLMRQHRP